MNELHEGHDADDSHETECATCREVVRAPDQHICIVLTYPPDCCMEDQ